MCNYRLLPLQKLQWIRHQQQQPFEIATATSHKAKTTSPPHKDNQNNNSTASPPPSASPKKKKSPKSKRKLHIPHFARYYSKKRNGSAESDSPYTELETFDNLDADLLEGSALTDVVSAADDGPLDPSALCVVVTPPGRSSCCGEVHTAAHPHVTAAAEAAKEKKAEPSNLMLEPLQGKINMFLLSSL